MAFTYDITTARGRIRFNLGDTDPAAYWFEDAEIDQMYQDEGGVDSGTAACLRALLASKGLRMKKFGVQGLAYDDTAQLDALRDLLALYGGDLPTLATPSTALLPMDSGFIEPVLG